MASYLPLAETTSTFHSPWNNLYQTKDSVQKSTIPVLSGTMIRSDLSSVRAGSTTFIDLPQNVVLQNSVLAVTFKKEDLKAKLALEAGWGYNCIRKITFQVAGSSQTLEITGEALLMKNIADAESNGKLSELMLLAGEAFNGAADATKDYTALVNLYLPWGSVSSKRFKGYDSSILVRPASIRVEMASMEEIVTRSAGNTSVNYPSEFKEAYIATRTQIMREKSSLPSLFGVGTSGRYSYSYIYPQHAVSKQFEGRSNKDNRQSLDLRGFRSGNLQSIDCWLERKTFSGPSDNLDRSAHARLMSYAPQNVVLLYGGQEIYRSDQNLGQMFNLCENEVNLSWSASNFAYNAGAVDIGTVGTARAGFLHIPIVQFNETLFCDLLQQGANVISQDIQMYFTTPEPSTLSPATTTEPQYVMHFNYNYLASVDTVGGNTQLQFTAPQVQISAPVV